MTHFCGSVLGLALAQADHMLTTLAVLLLSMPSVRCKVFYVMFLHSARQFAFVFSVSVAFATHPSGFLEESPNTLLTVQATKRTDRITSIGSTNMLAMALCLFPLYKLSTILVSIDLEAVEFSIL